MEYHLLNSYLKYQKDHGESFLNSLKRIPTSIKILFVITFICLVASLIFLFVDWSSIWFYIFTSLEVIMAFILYSVQERREIKYSRERYNDFIKTTRDLFDWISTFDIETKEDIELIKNRLIDDLNKRDELQRQRSEKIDKWMQTLVIPLILAIITSFISNKTDIETLMGYVFALLAFVGLIYAIVWVFRSIHGIWDNRKRDNIEYLIDDLQSIIDVVFVFRPTASIDEDKEVCDKKCALKSGDILNNN